MSILVIRKHQRFAVVRKAMLRCGYEDFQDCLLIEVSLGGCRIGNVDETAYRMGQPVTVDVEGYGGIDGEVRWIGNRCIGLNLSQPLHVEEISHLLEICRGEGCAAGRLSA